MFDSGERSGPQPGRYGWYAPGPARGTGKEGPAPQPGRYGWHTPAPRSCNPGPGQSGGDTAARTHSYQTPQQVVLPGRPVQAQLTPAAPPQESAEPKPRWSPGRGMIAVLLALSLLGGAVGGGAAVWFLGDQSAQPAATVQPSVILPAIAQPDIVTSEPAAVTAVLDVTYAVDRAAASVVEISLNTQVRTFFGGMREAQSAGSGVILSEDGYIVTNHHVIENALEIYVRTYDDREFPARLVGSDAQTDLAVIKIDARGLRPVSFADSDEVRVGQTAVAIGNPLGTLGGTVTQGIVSATDRQITIEGQEMTLMQTSAAVNPGNSGGGLFNAGGELIGVVNAKSSGMDIEGLGFAIPSNIVREVVDDLMQRGFVTGRPELGIQVMQISDLETARYHGLNDIGIFVMGVSRENGLEPYDQILYIDGEEVETITQISEAVQAAGVGGQMEITVVRGGETIVVEATVGEQVPELVNS